MEVRPHSKFLLFSKYILQKLQFLNLMGRIKILDFLLELTANTRSFKEKAASKKEDQKLEKTSNQCFLNSQQKGRFYQKRENTSNQYFFD